MPPLNPDDVDLAFRAIHLRAQLDDLLKLHGAKLVLGWEGKWAKVQFQFDDGVAFGKAITIVKVTKGKRARYYTDEEIQSGEST